LIVKLDWVDPGFLSDPYARYRELREEGPVHYDEVRDVWLLVRHADVVEVLRDHERFSASERPYSRGLPGSQTMLTTDPPEHTRLRTLVNRAFTARSVERLEGRIQEIADDLLDRASERGEMDVIADLAYPLPITVIAEMLGVPTDDRDFFREASSKIAVALGPIEDPEVAGRAMEGAAQLVMYFNELISTRSEGPPRRGAQGPDLISTLLAAEEAGDALSHGELVAMLLLLLVAGHETTVNLIGNGLLALLRHPDQLERLRVDEGIERSAVEELLRYDSPVQFTGRGVKVDVEIAGQPIPTGGAVSGILGAANRDPEVFADPDILDLSRDPCPHVSFGAGIHFCLGAQLARLEGRIALTTLVRRFPDLRPATEDLEWRPAPTLRGLAALPVRF
jgi:cytochrome P450